MKLGTAGLFTALMCGLAACQTTAPATDPALEAAYEARRLARAQFEPLDALAERGLEVQRADLMWGLLDTPSVELTRDADGQATVTLKFYGNEASGPVPAAVWNDLAARAPDAFRAADARAFERRARQIGYCHSWHELEAVLGSERMRLQASPCMGELQTNALAYADSLARVAIDYLPVCEPDRAETETQRSLMECGRRLGPPTEAYRALLEG